MFKIAQRTVNILKKKKIKISLAESCTGGLLSSAITSVNGASKIFTLGLITYSNSSKVKILNVPKKLIIKHGSVSQQCCLSMVNNLKKKSKTNIALAITGIAGPEGGTTKKPVGLVFIGIRFKKKIIIKKFLFLEKSRIQIQKIAVNKALKLIMTILT